MIPLSERVSRWVPVAATLLLAGMCVAYLFSVDSRNYNEPVIAQQMRDWMARGRLYGTFDTAPYNLPIYGPLYYLLLAPFAAVSRWGAMIGIRIVTLVSIGGSFVAARAAARTLGAGSAASALLVPLCLSFGMVNPDSGPTWLACALELTGLALLCRAGSDRRRIWLAYAVFVLATLIKQNAVGVALGTLAAAFFGEREGRGRVVFVGVVFLIAVALVHGIVDLATHGAYGRALRVSVVADPKSLWAAVSATHNVVVEGALATALALFVHIDSRPARLCVGATLVAAALGVVGVSKGGAGPHYFFSTVFCASIVACGTIERLAARERSVVAAALALMLLPSREQLANWKHQLFDRDPFQEEVALLKRAPPGPVLSEDAIVATLADRDGWAIDPYAYTLAVTRGGAKNGLPADLATCRAAKVLLFRQGFPANPAFLLRDDSPAHSEFLAALASSYREEPGTPEFRVFAPNCVRSVSASPR